MNGVIELIIFIACGAIWTTIAICFSGIGVLSHRYKKFYETTEEGRKLYCALYTLDRLGSKHDWLVNQMTELRDEIDKITYYFPDECKEKSFLVDMKNEYKEHSEELGRVKDERTFLSGKINKMVAALPKKYKGILEYNWELAKVEVEEESVCW